ncbi:ureidoglycolate lyase [Epibacterium ulvae]|uniref:ureidoglycolate lyase n=1 Tax=Epibacterium ulvae TaxID=1156985 RepID=UPI0024901B1E|nr:ureidoglycolate lyase [Epibacterium ulvae]
MKEVFVEPLTAEAFAPFGDILEAQGAADVMINQGRCGRFHNQAQLSFVDGAAGISLFQSEICALPFALELVERHPLGSQAFIPMSFDPFLVIVAEDHEGVPGCPRIFETQAGQGINLLRGVWHGVLTPLYAPGLFAVIDRIGEGNNLEEYWFEHPYQVTRRSR